MFELTNPTNNNFLILVNEQPYLHRPTVLRIRVQLTLNNFN